MKKLEATTSDSRAGDASRARSFSRHALAGGPEFTRAQALWVPGSRGRESYAQYQKLRALNPRHQIVVWAGEAMTAAFEAERR